MYLETIHQTRSEAKYVTIPGPSNYTTKKASREDTFISQ